MAEYFLHIYAPIPATYVWDLLRFTVQVTFEKFGLSSM